MSEDESGKSPLLLASKRATIADKVVVSRADLEQEHRLLIARIHLIRKQLGYPPLTQKEQNRQANK